MFQQNKKKEKKIPNLWSQESCKLQEFYVRELPTWSLNR